MGWATKYNTYCTRCLKCHGKPCLKRTATASGYWSAHHPSFLWDNIVNDHLVGGWALPLWKIWKSVGVTIPYIWKIIKFMFQSTNQFYTTIIPFIKVGLSQSIIRHQWYQPDHISHLNFPKDTDDSSLTSPFDMTHGLHFRFFRKTGGPGPPEWHGISHSSSLILSYFSWFNSHLCYHQPCHPMIVIYSLVVGYCSCIPLFSSCFPHNSQ